MSKILSKTIERVKVSATHVPSDMVLELLEKELKEGKVISATELNGDYLRIALQELQILKDKIYSVHLCNYRQIQSKGMENE